MKNIDLNSMSIEELWALHEEIASILTAKMEAEKLKLQRRLEQIEHKSAAEAPERRKYPKVHPKFRKPRSAAPDLVRSWPPTELDAQAACRR
jgi:DNA-binding protein H-NS